MAFSGRSRTESKDESKRGQCWARGKKTAKGRTSCHHFEKKHPCFSDLTHKYQSLWIVLNVDQFLLSENPSERIF